MKQKSSPIFTALQKVFLLTELCICLSFSFYSIYGQTPGSLDPNFGSDGKSINTILSTDTANAMARQPDGKLIVVGTAQTKQPSLSFGIVRMNEDGSLDSSFGESGRVTTAIEGVVSRAYAVTLQPDGKIIVAGSSTGFDESFTVARYNSDGSLDNSFNNNGTKVIDLGYDDTVYSVLLQTDGKIVLVGTAETPNNSSDFAIVRLNNDGSLDTSFDGDGVVYTQVGAGNGFDAAYAGFLQANGKIVAVGTISSGINTFQTAVVRYNTDGTLDTSFDEDGKALVTPDAPVSKAYAVAQQPDGKLVVGGRSSDFAVSNVNFTLLRFNPDGSLDTTFNDDGKIITSISDGDEEINALLIQPDGKILVAGYSNAILNISSRNFTLARFNSDGSIDTTFDEDGILVAPTANEEDRARALLLDATGKIFVAGYRAENTSRQYEFTVLKLNSDGSRDNTFSSDGLVSVWVGADDFAQEQISAIAVQADGKIIAGGSASDDFTLVRYNTDGSFDNTFNGDGRVILSPLTNVNNQGNSSVTDVAIQSDGKIVAVGSMFDFSTSSREIVVARFLQDGSPDTSFDDDGKVITRINQSMDAAHGVVLQPDGKIVIAGGTSPGTNKTNFLLIRYNQNGLLDTTFGNGGIVVTTIGTSHDEAYAIALQRDGKIVAAGYSNGQFAGPRYAAVRYNSDGSLDTGFGDGGKVANTASGKAYSVAVQINGKIVLGGTSLGGINGPAFSAVRLNSDGSPDMNFGQAGTTITEVRFRSEGRAMVVQGDGKIILAGFSFASNLSQSDFTLVRYDSNGSLDTTFDDDGIVTTSISNSVDEAYAIALQADGKIIAGGKANSSEYGDDFAIARYLSGYTPIVQRSPFDFDGDGKSDISVFRPDNGAWYLNQSQSGFAGIQFGISTDKLAPADYDGDDKTDIAVYRNGSWYLLRSTAGFAAVSFGLAEDIPQPADFDGDGRAELAVYCPSAGSWYVLNLVNNQFNAVQFGVASDKPVVGDYDGDGKADYAVYRPENGAWYLLQSTAGFAGVQFGISTDIPVPADYDGDGRTDPAVYRDGNWYLLQSTKGFAGFQFGIATDIPTPADYDGDGKADAAVFRDGNWYLLQSTSGFSAVQFGQANDKSVPSAFVQ